MLITLFGIVILARLVILKARFPMLVTPFGIVTLVILRFF